MPMYDLGIVNGHLYVDGNWIDGNLYIKGGKIAAISEGFAEAAEEYDCRGKIVLPGLIDPHVHLSMDAYPYKTVDSFYTGTVAAAFGGITTIIDFLDSAYSEADIEKLYNERMELARKCVIDYSFHAAVAALSGSVREAAVKALDFGMPTVKIYTTYKEQGWNTPDRITDELLSISKEYGLRILAHAENDDLIMKSEEIPVSMHETARPVLAEISEVIKLAEMAEYRNGDLYIVHVSSGSTVERLKQKYNKMLGSSLILESCPHYFTFSSDVYRESEGYLYTMTPPLRCTQEVEALRKNISYINTIATDHCTFKRIYKCQNDINKIPMGVGGIEYSFQIMYNMFGNAVIDKYTKNVAMAHGLFPKKGVLLPGADADVVIFDPWADCVLYDNHSANDHCIYNNVRVKGQVVSTVSRGRFVVKDRVFYGGQGAYIERKL